VVISLDWIGLDWILQGEENIPVHLHKKSATLCWKSPTHNTL